MTLEIIFLPRNPFHIVLFLFNVEYRSNKENTFRKLQMN